MFVHYFNIKIIVPILIEIQRTIFFHFAFELLLDTFYTLNKVALIPYFQFFRQLTLVKVYSP